CDECEAYYTDSVDLVQHMQLDHNATEFWKCSDCPQMFIDKQNRTEHRKVHASKKSIARPASPTNGVVSPPLDAPVVFKKKFSVSCAQEKFRSRPELAEHKKTHGEFSYMCKESGCNAACKGVNDLKLHVLVVHRGKEPYKCSQCNVVYAVQRELRRHEVAHLTEKTVPCRYCSKMFTRPVYRNMHERIHTGERPYLCKICGERFRLMGALKCHLRRHVNMKP
ncbi:PREDICTED: zinc finger protein 28-like, partial [Priapulus caudatus]|uniref:Zinc finger protein 28-like n=1 Tax=Priapulus caudatus TaxID=37621 RepID=A0ABM1F3Y1_PRICU